jgi:hypothetical protein
MRGTSDAGIRAYAEGNVRRPRTELLRAIADVLQVRAEWLVFGKGEMTEELEQRRGLLAKLDEMREEEAAAFHAAVVRAMRAPSDREPRYWMPAAWEASRRLGLDAKKLGRQLAAPLAALGIDPGRMTEDAFNDHVTRMVSVLLALDGEQKAQAPYRTTKEV